MEIRFRTALTCLLLAQFSGCIGGTLSNHQDIEILPLRPATEDEGKDLKHCLKSANQAQDQRKNKTGHYAPKLHDLPLDGACKGLLLSQKISETGYEIRAEIREDDTSVRWSVNDQGVIEEHLDPEGDLDLEL